MMIIIRYKRDLGDNQKQTGVKPVPSSVTDLNIRFVYCALMLFDFFHLIICLQSFSYVTLIHHQNL